MFPIRILPCLALLGLSPSPLGAHFHLAIPDRPALGAGEKTVLRLFFGHPFEHELADMAPPEGLKLVPPDGAAEDVTGRVVEEKVKSGGPNEIRRYAIDFAPKERGDYIFSLHTRLEFAGEEYGFYRDFVKVVIHVQAEKGWDRAVGDPIEIVPLARPYGLRPGALFQARALLDGKPIEGASVEFERYNPRPPEKLPEGEFITSSARTGPGGLIAFTPDAVGWWSVSVSARRGALLRDGKEHPLTVRATFWFYCGEPLGAGR